MVKFYTETVHWGAYSKSSCSQVANSACAYYANCLASHLKANEARQRVVTLSHSNIRMLEIPDQKRVLLEASQTSH